LRTIIFHVLSELINPNQDKKVIMHRRSIHLCIAVGFFAVAACTGISPAGIIAARSLDPLGTPPDQIGIAVGVPGNVQLSSGDAVMRIAFRGGTLASTIVIEEEVRLQLAQDESGQIAANASDEVIYSASLLPRDAARFASAQQAIREAREKGVDGVGTLNIEVTGGCYVGAEPDGLPTSTWLRTDPSRPFVAMTQRVDAFEALGDAGLGLRSILSPC
jgi:hypothetical protein